MQVREAKIKCSLRACVILYFLVFGQNGNASCRCVCAGGLVKAECIGRASLKPFCPPKVCRKPSKNFLPRAKPSYPPPLRMNMSDCQQRRVLNPQTNRMIWRTICRSEHSF